MSFLASTFLWLLPLISLPLIFHLLKKRSYKDIKFSTLRFFNILEDSSIKKINLINILLLIIRTLIILFLIIIISKPHLDGTSRNSTNKENDVCVILIDNSYSNKSFINKESKKVISNILNAYDDNTLFKITTTNKNFFIVDDYKKNIIPFNQRLLNPVYTSNSSNIASLLEKSDYTNYDNRDLYIISDMQENSFKNTTISDLDNWNVFLYKTKENESIYLSTLNIDNDFINIDELININITVNNNTNENFLDKEIQLFINNINVGNNICSVNSKENEVYTFKTSIPTYGMHKCYFLLNNVEKYYFNINIPEKINIAIIHSDYNNSKFLINAINAYNHISKNIILNLYSSYDFNLVNEIFDTIIKFDTSDISTQLLNKIFKQTDNLIVVPTNEINLDVISQYFQIDLNYNKTITSIKDGYITIDNKKTYDNKIKQIFANNNDIEIYKYYKIPKNKFSIADFENNNSFISKYNKLNHELILFSTPLHIESNSIPISSSFIPIINELIIKGNRKHMHAVGDTLYFNKYSSSNNIQHIINKDTSTYTYDYLRNNFIILKEPGYHNILTGTESLNISANINEIEYNDIILSKDKLSTYFNNYLLIEKTDNLNEILSKQISGIHLWRYFFYAVILLIIAEMLISNIYIYKND